MKPRLAQLNIAKSDAEHLIHLPLPYNAGITDVYHFAQFYEMLET